MWMSVLEVSRIYGPEGGYLEDIEGSLSEFWRSGSYLIVLMRLLYPKKDNLKVVCHVWIHLLEVCQEGGAKKRCNWIKVSCQYLNFLQRYVRFILNALIPSSSSNIREYY